MFNAKIRQKTVRAKHASQIDFTPSNLPSKMGVDLIPENLSSLHSSLDKIAQLGKVDVESLKFDELSDAKNKGIFYRRARAKRLSNSLIECLLKLESPLKNGYANTYKCTSILTHNHATNKITARYCKNRWCMVCNRIRTAQLMIKYMDVMKSWENKYFVTLTIPNPMPYQLRDAIGKMDKDMRCIQDVMKKRGDPLVGIKKLECTKQPERVDFHPHYHIVVVGEKQANTLVYEWLLRNESASANAQDVRPCKEDNDSDLKELFKYFTKIISGKGGVDRRIITRDLDIIFRCMVGRRVFQPFGFKLPPPTTTKDKELVDAANEYARKSMYEWVDGLSDWVGVDTGEMLTGYKPSESFSNLLNSIE